MYFKSRLISTLLLGVLSSSATALDVEIADESSKFESNQPLFELSPSKCVALNEGRTCFADVSFIFRLPAKGEYCLRELGQVTPIGCWKAVETVNYLHSFANSSSTTYELIDRLKGDVLATQTIEVNWVHKIQTKKRRWRLF